MIINQYFLAYQLSHPLSGPGPRADPPGWPKIMKKFLCFSGCFWPKGTHYIFSSKLFFNYLLGPGVFLWGPGLGSTAHLTKNKDQIEQVFLLPSCPGLPCPNCPAYCDPPWRYAVSHCKSTNIRYVKQYEQRIVWMAITKNKNFPVSKCLPP